MAEYSATRREVDLFYSPRATYSFGISSLNILRDELDDRRFSIAQGNYLLNRWNLPSAQANLYVAVGMGAAERGDRQSVAARASLIGDYETRRLYSSLLIDRLEGSSSADLSLLRARFGALPFPAPLDRPNLWILAQFDYSAQNDETLSVSPILRLFYRNVAVELGVGVEEGSLMSSLMWHF